jgi:hypothetical protein
MTYSHAHRPIAADLFEVQRRMARVGFQKLLVGIG